MKGKPDRDHRAGDDRLGGRYGRPAGVSERGEREDRSSASRGRADRGGNRRERPRDFDRAAGSPQRRGRNQDKPERQDKPGRDRGKKSDSRGPWRDTRHGDRETKRRESETRNPTVSRPEEKPKAASKEPELPEGVTSADLHGEVRRELRSVPKVLADTVAAHLAAVGTLIDSEPQAALAHARFARKRASRIGVVRETNGIAAYQAGEWNEALSELRAARRMGGGSENLAIIADCERALGRPERALDLSRSPEAAELAGQEAVELRIVAAGARRDLGEVDAAVVSLQTPELDPQLQEPWSARLFYAYADNLLAADRPREAFTWFVHAAHADDYGDTDAPERLEELFVRLEGPDAAHELIANAEESAEAGEDEGDTH